MTPNTAAALSALEQKWRGRGDAGSYKCADELAAVLTQEGAEDGDAALGMQKITCAVRENGWLYIRHADGQWVSAAQLQPFSMSILHHAGSIK